MKSISSSCAEPPAKLQSFIGASFLRIPPGRFQMGAPDDDRLAEENEKPAHEVEIARVFYLAAAPVTLWQYRMFRDYRVREHSAFEDEHAVNFVSCEDADAYIAWLNDAKPRSETHVRYRLPTENEWEYACRAGAATRFHFGDDPDFSRLHNYAWFSGNTWDLGLRHPQPVARKTPNRFGLYDMHGNVWEWTSDGWAEFTDIVRTGEAARSKATRVLRGGGFCHEPRYLRSSDRDHYEPGYRHYYTGFRLCLDLDE